MVDNKCLLSCDFLKFQLEELEECVRVIEASWDSGTVAGNNNLGMHLSQPNQIQPQSQPTLPMGYAFSNLLPKIDFVVLLLNLICL